MDSRAAVPLIAAISGRSAEDAGQLPPFHKGLADSGFVEGQNVLIEYHGAGGQYEQLPPRIYFATAAVISTSKSTYGTPSAAT
jgi:putative tryptophan/tyrosine transport system substrate-binding protein